MNSLSWTIETSKKIEKIKTSNYWTSVGSARSPGSWPSHLMVLPQSTDQNIFLQQICHLLLTLNMQLCSCCTTTQIQAMCHIRCTHAISWCPNTIVTTGQVCIIRGASIHPKNMDARTWQEFLTGSLSMELWFLAYTNLRNDCEHDLFQPQWRRPTTACVELRQR